MHHIQLPPVWDYYLLLVHGRVEQAVVICIVYGLNVLLDVLASSFLPCDHTIRICRIVTPPLVHMTDVMRGLGPVLVFT